MKKIDRELSKTVDRMLNRRCQILFGRDYKDVSVLQQDICLLFLNLTLDGGMSVVRNRLSHVEPAAPDVQTNQR